MSFDAQRGTLWSIDLFSASIQEVGLDGQVLRTCPTSLQPQSASGIAVAAGYLYVTVSR